MNIKMVVTDLDNTLLHHDKTVRQRLLGKARVYDTPRLSLP